MQQRDARKPEPCPCGTGREFSRVSAHAHAARSRPWLSSARECGEAGSSRFQAPPGGASWAASQGGQGQEFLGVRRASGTHRRSIARSPETRREFPPRPFAETRKDVTARRGGYSRGISVWYRQWLPVILSQHQQLHWWIGAFVHCRSVSSCVIMLYHSDTYIGIFRILLFDNTYIFAKLLLDKRTLACHILFPSSFSDSSRT